MSSSTSASPLLWDRGPAAAKFLRMSQSFRTRRGENKERVDDYPRSIALRERKSSLSRQDSFPVDLSSPESTSAVPEISETGSFRSNTTSSPAHSTESQGLHKQEVHKSGLRRGSMMRKGNGNQNKPLDLTVEFLDLSSSACLDKETKLMANALEAGQLKNLKYLVLEGNMGDLGVRSFLRALEQGHLANLEKLMCWGISSYDQISTKEEGTERIANSISDCKLSGLQMLDFKACLQKLKPHGACLRDIYNYVRESRNRPVKGTWSGCFVSCCCHQRGCRCCIPDVLTGDDGLILLVDALEKCRQSGSMTTLYLEDNYIGDKGAERLAELLSNGHLPGLEVLDLHNNEIGKDGAEAFVQAFLENPLLTASVDMDWPPDGILRAEAEAFKECNIRLEHLLLNELRNEVRREEIAAGKNKDIKYYLEDEMNRSCWFLLDRFRTPKYSLFLCCQNSCCRYPMEGSPEHFKPRGIKIEKRTGWARVAKKKRLDRQSREVHITHSSEMFIKNALSQQKEDEMERRRRGKGSASKSRKRENQNVVANQTGKDDDIVGSPKRGGRRKKKIDRETRTILNELFMLAERRPDEFYSMFGLRRVLVKSSDSPASDLPSPRDVLYSPLWLCNECVKAKKGSVITLTSNSKLGIPDPRDSPVNLTLHELDKPELSPT